MKYDTVLFDLDGTLLDTNELIIASFLHTLRTFFPDRHCDRNDVIAFMGLPLLDILEQHCGTEDVQAMAREYRAYNMRMHDEMVRIFPHVEEVLDRLARHHVRMGVVTTKQSKTAVRGLALFGLEHHMRCVIGIDEVEHPKPHPEPVLKAMARLNADPGKTLMVGDNAYDILAAQEAGIHAAGVAWSLKGEDTLKSFEPEYMLTDMRDLYPIVGVSP